MALTTGAARAVAAILRPGQPLAEGEMRFEAVVDGARIAFHGEDSTARLLCRLCDDLPGEPALRALLGRFLRHADAGAELICIDPQGALVLLLDLTPGEALEEQVARFCDAALHWRAAAAALATPAPAWTPAAAPQFIYP